MSDWAAVNKLTQEFMDNLGKLSSEFRDKLFQLLVSKESDDSDSDDEETYVTQELSHKVQQEVLQISRRRIICSRTGQNILSYADLIGQRASRISKTKRTHMLGPDTVKIASGLRD